MIEYPYTNLHELNLDWILSTTKESNDLATEASETAAETKEFVDEYFDNLDVQEEINTKVDELVTDGTIGGLITPTAQEVAEETTEDWLSANITQPTTPAIDASLSVSGAAADAGAVGDYIDANWDNITSNLSWEIGGVNVTYGYGTSSTYIARTAKMYAEKPILALAQGNIELAVLRFSKTDIPYSYTTSSSIINGYKGYNGGFEKAVTIPAGTAYAIVARDSTAPTTPISDITDISNYVYLYENRHNETFKKLNLFPETGGFRPYFINSSGAFVTYSNNRALCSDFIPATQNDTIFVHIDKSANCQNIVCGVYDSTCTFLERLSNTVVSSGSYEDVFFELTNANTAFVVIAFFTQSPNTLYTDYPAEQHIMITKNEKTSYAPEWINERDYYQTLNSITNPYNRIDNFHGKVVSFLGDSITTYAGENASTDSDGHLIADGTWTYAGNHCRYPQSNLVTNPFIMYYVRVMERLQMTLGVNESWAGSLITWDGVTNTTDNNSSVNIASETRIGHLADNGTPDIIIVNAGTNDINNNVTVGTFDTTSPENITLAEVQNLPVTTFADGVRTMLIRLLYYYPTAEVVVLLPNYSGGSYDDPEKLDRYVEVMKEACDYFGVKYIDLRAGVINIFNRSTYMPDNVHYGALGMDVVTERVVKELGNT